MSEEIVETSSPEIIPEEPKAISVEDKARAAGWRPLEEFDGDKSTFRSAREFLDRGELLDHIHGLKRTIKEQTDALQHLADFNKKIEAVTRERTISELESKHRNAIEIGDVATAQAGAKEMIEASKVSLTSSQPMTPVVTEEAKAFVARNASWFNNNSAENAAMTAFAVRRDAELTGQGLSPEDSLKIVDSEIRKTYAHRFVTTPHASAVAAPTGSPKVLREDDARTLPEYHQKMIKQLEGKLKNFDKKAYIANVKKLLEK